VGKIRKNHTPTRAILSLIPSVNVGSRTIIRHRIERKNYLQISTIRMTQAIQAVSCRVLLGTTCSSFAYAPNSLN
jgi:hypothetical protein